MQVSSRLTARIVLERTVDAGPTDTELTKAEGAAPSARIRPLRLLQPFEGGQMLATNLLDEADGKARNVRFLMRGLAT